MGNSLRCCLACVIPCGALDLIRIVHLNGNVDEITRPVTAGEILEANPDHILSKPSSQGVVRKILIISPESELKRGSIYFLIPSTSLPENKKGKHLNQRIKSRKISSSNSNSNSTSDRCDRYLEEAVSSEKKSRRADHRRRHSRSKSVSVWQPHLECITED